MTALSRKKRHVVANSRRQFAADVTSGKTGHSLLPVKSAHVLLRNPAGKLLVCRRPMTKKRYPGQITSSAGGHVEKGELPFAAAARELKEELGISAKLQDAGSYIVWSKKEHALHWLFVGTVKTATKIVPDTREIAAYYFESPSVLRKDLTAHPRKYAKPFHGALMCYLRQKKKLRGF